MFAASSLLLLETSAIRFIIVCFVHNTFILTKLTHGKPYEKQVTASCEIVFTTDFKLQRCIYIFSTLKEVACTLQLEVSFSRW